MVFFRNRSYQIHFELLDSFRHQGCPLCDLLETKDQELVGGFVGSVYQGEKRAILLLQLCSPHRISAKGVLNRNPEAIDPIKKIVSEGIKEITSHSKASRSLWRRDRGDLSGGCPLCQKGQSQERAYCRAMVHFLGEMDFWKEFQLAPLLCLDHQRKCMAIGNSQSGLLRLLQDQASKLNVLLGDLIDLEATGRHQESKSEALEWLADSKAAALDISLARPHPDQDAIPIGLPSGSDGAQPSDGQALNPEALRFENEKLKRKIDNLTALLGKAETRAASLHYRVAELSEANKILEMNCTGANAFANGLEKVVQNLKEEIKRLKAEAVANSEKRMS